MAGPETFGVDRVRDGEVLIKVSRGLGIPANMTMGHCAQMAGRSICLGRKPEAAVAQTN